MSSLGIKMKNVVDNVKKAFKEQPKRNETPLQKTANPPAPNPTPGPKKHPAESYKPDKDEYVGGQNSPALDTRMPWDRPDWTGHNSCNRFERPTQSQESMREFVQKLAETPPKNVNDKEERGLMVDLPNASPIARQAFIEEALKYAVENPNTPEGQRAAAYAMEALSHQPPEFARPTLAKLQEEGKLEGLVKDALIGQVNSPVRMNGVEKLTADVAGPSTDGYYSFVGGSYEEGTVYVRIDPEEHCNVGLAFWAGIMMACDKDPAVKTYVSNNTKMKDALAYHFKENFDAAFEYPGFRKNNEDLISPAGRRAFTNFFNVISTPPPSKYAGDAIGVVMDGVEGLIDPEKNPEEPKSFTKSEAENWGSVLTAMSSGLSATSASMVDDEAASAQADKDEYNKFIAIVGATVGDLNGTSGAILELVLTDIVNNSGGQYTLADAQEELKKSGIDLEIVGGDMPENLAQRIKDDELRDGFEHGLFNVRHSER